MNTWMSFHHLKRFQKQMGAMKVKAYLINHVPDLFYLAGFSAEGCLGLLTPRRAWLFVPLLLQEQAEALARGFEVRVVPRSLEAYNKAAELLAQQGLKKCGYDPYHVSEAVAKSLRKSFPRMAWIPLPGATVPLRVKKDIDEIQALRRAGHLVARGFEHIKKLARPGMREIDLAAEFERFIRQNGALKASFDSIVAAGENAAYPHYITGNRKFRKNDIVLCDIGCLVEGYCSDLTRTFFLGKIRPLGEKIYNIVAQAQKLAIQAVRPGVKTAQIDQIARECISRAGYGRRFIHSTGHGVGVEIHEAPWVSPNSQDTLEPGMVITVEPGIYLPGWGGVRMEDTLLVTAKGYEVLTK